MQNRFIRLIPGAPAAVAQFNVWGEQLRDLRPLFPIVIPFFLWVFIRSYNEEQERMRRDRLAPILRPSERLPKDRRTK